MLFYTNLTSVSSNAQQQNACSALSLLSNIIDQASKLLKTNGLCDLFKRTPLAPIGAEFGGVVKIYIDIFILYSTPLLDYVGGSG